jgi:succinate dehydrogenase/fumarate reductase flavoprotein subunit
MANWHDYAVKGQIPEWPYPIRYENEQVIETDVLVLGGGIAGCWAAIGAARKGVRVALVEKSATVRSGAGGPGCDHWCDAPANPSSKVDPDDWAQRLANGNGGYANGIGRQIQCRENYDTMLELEQMGGKIRDTEGEFIAAEGYDEKTKFVFSPRSNPFHESNVVMRVWGTTFKPAMERGCKRLGVKIYDRVMATSLLNEGGAQGHRVVGATGFNNRTGEFMVFKAKATILCMSGTAPIWTFDTELAAISTFRPRTLSGDGIAMAWRAGCELALLEKSERHRLGGGYKHQWYAGAGDASYENVPLVDANGKALPGGLSLPHWGRKMDAGDARVQGGVWDQVREGVLKGEYELPVYGDFPAMPPIERKVTWKFLLSEESMTKIIVDSYEESGFDMAKDRLMGYQLLEGNSPPQWREIYRGVERGGVMIDWDLKTNLDGLYAAGEQLFVAGDHSFAAATGRYAGRKAADYALQVSHAGISPEQVGKEKARVYGPTKRTEGIDWKELHAAIARVMQWFCAEYKTERLLKMGLESLNEIEQRWVPNLYASDPHKLLRGIEDLSILNYAQAILHSSLARKAGTKWLDFHRIDYPQMDPPEWNKLTTIRLENDNAVPGERPLHYAGDLKKNYEAHNRDYTAVWQG